MIYGKLKSAGDGRPKSNRRFSKGRTSLERRNEGQRSVASVFSGRTGLLVGLVVGIWLFRFDGKITDPVEQLHLDVFDPEFGQSTTNNTHKTHKTTRRRKELWDKLNIIEILRSTTTPRICPANNPQGQKPLSPKMSQPQIAQRFTKELTLRA